jgi:hypothetical protein
VEEHRYFEIGKNNKKNYLHNKRGMKKIDK